MFGTKLHYVTAWISGTNQYRLRKNNSDRT